MRHLQTKESSLSKQSRRSIATLLDSASPRVESARIRVENIIRQDILVELLEILELYCELLLARIHMLDGTGLCDPGLEEAVKSIIYAAPRTEVKELHQVRDLLAARFGKEFALSAAGNVGGGVADRVIKKLGVEAPSPELVNLYLKEIARTYGVDFDRTPPRTPPPPQYSDDDDGPPTMLTEISVTELVDPKARELVTNAASPPRKVLPKSPIHVAPASPSTENPHPVVKFPEAPEVKITPRQQQQPRLPRTVGMNIGGISSMSGGAISGGKSKEDKEVDDLLARFAALKKR